MHLKTSVITTVLAAAALVWSPGQVAYAQGTAAAPLRLANNATLAAATAEYWTAERLANAQPITLKTSYAVESLLEPSAEGTPRSSTGRRPEAGATAKPVKLFDPAQAVPTLEELTSGIVPSNAGTLGAHFTSSRLTPTTANTAYPFRTVGKLFFTTTSGGNAVCSASVIGFRVVVTAGHCVHQGSGGVSGFYRNFLFVPAFRNGTAPFGTWNWAFVTVTGTWASGGGGVPNAADYAMFEMRDRAVAPTRIGAVTGSLGWRTVSLRANHTTMLGYPCNLDNCQQMHRVDAGAFRATAPNNVEYGSDARGGSSGGPWVQNFGEPSVGQVGGTNPNINRVVAVTSYIYTSLDPKVQGASIPDSRWVQLWNIVCARRVGNCTP